MSTSMTRKYCFTRHHKLAHEAQFFHQSYLTDLDERQESPGDKVHPVLLNQPIFVAISTNPLILVPCTYNPSTGALDFPNNNGSSNTSNLFNIMNQSSSSSHQVFPREEDVALIQRTLSKNSSYPKELSLKQQAPQHAPQHESEDEEEQERCCWRKKKETRKTSKNGMELQPLDLSSKPTTSGELLTSMMGEEESSLLFLSKDNLHAKDSLHAKSTDKVNDDTKSDTLDSTRGGSSSREGLLGQRKRRRHSNAIVIAPGSSFLNKPPHDTDVTTDDNNSRSSCYSPVANHAGPSIALPASLSGLPLGLPLAGLPGMAFPSASSDALHHQGIVKQGTYKCKDCNIVFYKHENFLVHKSLYCASRRLSEQLNAGHGLQKQPPHLHVPSSPSPDPPESDHEPHSSPEVSLDGKPHIFGGYTTRSTVSPVRSVTSTPPLASPTHHQGQCVACGIRFTSMDTLHAHQAFYCLKRGAGLKNNVQVSDNGFLPTALNGIVDKNDFDRPHIDLHASPPPMSVSSTNGTPHSSTSVSNSSTAASTTNNNSNGNKSSHGSHLNMQSFKCTICGYKGHTMRGMRTHVRIHADKMQGMTEETFIEYLHEDSHLQSGCNENRPLTGPGSRGSRRRSLDHPESSSSSNKRRRSNNQLRY